MALIPGSIVGRLVACVWLLLSAGALSFASEQQQIHDMPEAFVWLMNFLTIPVGFPVATAVAIASSEISKYFGIAYHPFWYLVSFWFGVTVTGYLQWFVVLALIWRKLHAPRAI